MAYQSSELVSSLSNGTSDSEGVEGAPSPADDDGVTPTIKYLLMTGYSFFIIISLVANLLVCLVLLSGRCGGSRKFHFITTPTGLFLLNMALGDILINVLHTPFKLDEFGRGSWVFGEAMCHISKFAQYCSLFITSWTFVAIALAIKKPLFPRRSMYVAVAGIWILSGCLSLPYAIFQKLLSLSDRGVVVRSRCVDYYPDPAWVYVLSLGWGTYALLSLGSVITIGLLGWRPSCCPDPMGAAHRQVRQRSLRRLFWMSILYCVRWLPFLISQILVNTGSVLPNVTLYFTIQWLIVSDTCWMPLLYRWIFPDFYTECKSLLCVWGGRPSPPPPDPEQPPPLARPLLTPGGEVTNSSPVG